MATVGKEEDKMKNKSTINSRRTAKASNWILLWLLGIPLPILLLVYLLRGCT
jgi:hypothetical protein